MSRKCLIVLGMHRSGTSAFGGAFEELGIKMGKELLEADLGNEKGFFENKKIYEFNDKQLLPYLETSWDGLQPLSNDWWKSEKLEFLYERAKNIIVEDYEAYQIFGIKDPRICILYPFWEKVLKNLDVEPINVLPIRNPFEVAISLSKRGEISLGQGMMLWARYVLASELYTREAKRVFVSYDHLLSDPIGILTKISDAIKVTYPESLVVHHEKIHAFLSKNMQHNVADQEQMRLFCPRFISELYDKVLHVGNDCSDGSRLHTFFNETAFEYQKYLNICKSIERQNDTEESFLGHDLKYMQVFFDYGNGFSEDLSIKSEIENLGELHKIELDLPFNEKVLSALRIDPLNMPCSVRISNIRLVTKESGEEVQLGDDIEFGEQLFFDSDDPSIFFEGFEPGLYQKVMIDIEYIAFNKEALRMHLDTLLRTEQTLAGQVENLTENLNSELSKIKTLEQIVVYKEQVIAGYVTSKSWRYTKPLRDAAAFARKIFNKSNDY